jgi:hypothetical protein
VGATFWQPPQGPAAAAAQILDLAVTRTLRYETGARVIDLVAKHQSGGKALSPYGPAGVSSLDVVPLDVLHALGVATTPQIPSAVHLSQWWAVLRYLWAFRPSAQGQGLALDSGTSIIRHHQRTLLSEQLAIGLAGWYIEMVAGVPSVHSVDAEFAVYDPAWGTLLTWGGDLLPDYLYFSSASPTAMPTHLHLVECKGTREPLPHYATAATHNTQYRTLIQLAHAAKQLEGITIGGLNVVRVAFAATLEEDEICLYAVDPPDDDERDAQSSEDPAGRKTLRSTGSRVSSMPTGSVRMYARYAIANSLRTVGPTQTPLRSSRGTIANSCRFASALARRAGCQTQTRAGSATAEAACAWNSMTASR